MLYILQLHNKQTHSGNPDENKLTRMLKLNALSDSPITTFQRDPFPDKGVNIRLKL